MSWNDDNVARLKELWDQGLPTAQIGKLLGFTKNAVVGKAHRIGLERRPSPIRRTSVKPDRKKARSPVMPKLNFENTLTEEKVYSPQIRTFQPSVKNIFITLRLGFFKASVTACFPAIKKVDFFMFFYKIKRINTILFNKIIYCIYL